LTNPALIPYGRTRTKNAAGDVDRASTTGQTICRISRLPVIQRSV
jgi:hypothetical protein